VTFLSDDKMDPVLEISIDYGRPAVRVHLRGDLDACTAATLTSILGDLILDGFKDVVLDLGQAVIDASGASAMILCQRRAQEAGGMLSWEAPASTCRRA
jgi:anti-anti-sigma regulatory factor